MNITGDNTRSPIKVRLVHNTLMVVKAVVNGSVNLDMLMDTGASRTHVPSEIFGHPNREVIISSLCFENGICANNLTAMSTNSALTQEKVGYFNGIIGVDILRHFDVTFDYSSQLIYFYDILESSSPGLVTIPIHYKSSRPIANVSIEGISQGDILLDTGSAYTRITVSKLAALNQKPEILFETFVFKFDTHEKAKYVSLAKYCIDIACPGEIIVQTGSWPAVGGTFFREYLTTFKFSQNVVKLYRFYDRSHIKKSGIQRMGLQLNIHDAGEIIYAKKDGFAWKGGIRRGDEIVSVNTIPIYTLGYFGIYKLFEDTSIKEYQFRIKTSKGKVKDVTVVVE